MVAIYVELVSRVWQGGATATLRFPDQTRLWTVLPVQEVADPMRPATCLSKWFLDTERPSLIGDWATPYCIGKTVQEPQRDAPGLTGLFDLEAPYKLEGGLYKLRRAPRPSLCSPLLLLPSLLLISEVSKV